MKRGTRRVRKQHPKQHETDFLARDIRLPSKQEKCAVLFLVGPTNTWTWFILELRSNYFKDSQMYLPEMFEFFEPTMQIILSLIKTSQQRTSHCINSGGLKQSETIRDHSPKAHNYHPLQCTGMHHFNPRVAVGYWANLLLTNLIKRSAQFISSLNLSSKCFIFPVQKWDAVVDVLIGNSTVLITWS